MLEFVITGDGGIFLVFACSSLYFFTRLETMP
jgi:hypothetical protein